MNHEKYMKIALNLAKQGIGKTGVNPSVGCVIVKDDFIIAASRTANSGRPHAEFLALQNIDATDAIAYVTLEPCAHEAQTPSCARLLVDSGISEIYIATKDPDVRTAGFGIKILEDAGVKVHTGLLEEQAREVNLGFFKKLEERKPFVALKVATDTENNYLAGDGKPKWVTGELARKYVHIIRSKFDVIITGTGTVLADNPKLNVRLAGMEEFSPEILVLGERDISFTNLANSIQVNGDLEKVLQNLVVAGTNRVLIEAGPKLSNAFLKAGLVDEIYWFKSSEKLQDTSNKFLDKSLLENFKQKSERKFGDDVLYKLARKTREEL